jgi:hypothetical protein
MKQPSLRTTCRQKKRTKKKSTTTSLSLSLYTVPRVKLANGEKKNVEKRRGVGWVFIDIKEETQSGWG